ncbi:ABC-2 family transporter protein [Acetanaerobacterium elongatum]|uniref:ABC-2 type transport system permease protein n=1 Tax=Acetanaerobacterium elongatum TaxID=258515 RepID=A0A1G9U4D1_9FIRM|nr:ABC-2 family transporter protein [Acetanaerobacterium elongatum]SDM54742.1 ABC-2 type transport system permease protein [Acetanaerobacterium elongatum]
MNVLFLFRLWRQYAKMDLLWFLRDMRYCLMWVASELVATLTAISTTLLLCVRFGGIGGMSFDQMLFMCSYAMVSDGIIVAFFGGYNILHISRIIGRGQLDHMLIQPVPIWMQLLTQGFSPVSGNGKVLLGIPLLCVAVSRLQLTVTPVWVLRLLSSLVCSSTVILAFTYIISCSAFFAPVAAEEISGKALDLFGETKYFSLGGLPSAGITALCTVLPVGLAAWFPANVLLGQAPAGLPAILLLIVAAVMLIIANILFKKGIHFYEKNGSNRYSGFGAR